ncbi:hypothetical protein RN001_002960 [Aquatica leii]|uniref:Uncharacterized protein n=1 Tax=Aquatica leii TaxID=1421715 RepID=A0AAN7PHL7_9COLE|nr:hypothetical protein RN001_002960 [Aquatica leii]
MVVEFPKFCFGVTLKTGTIIIGVVQSIFSFMFMILCAAYAENPNELVDMSDKSIIPDIYTLRCLLILISTVSALQCIFSILLIFGAETNRPLLLLPWIILNPTAIVIYVITTIIGIIHHTGLNNRSFIVGHLIVGLAVCLIGGYNTLRVYNYYRHLKTLNF